MTTPDTLRQLLSEATPGPWEVSTSGLERTLCIGHASGDVIGTSQRGFGYMAEEYTCATDADARLIAAAPTHLADLITALEQIERVRELHKPVTQLGGNIICPSCMDDSTVAYLPAPYPCPTIRILDGNE